jgi:glycosyltransferase involved in cell wall biosynthesis
MGGIAGRLATPLSVLVVLGVLHESGAVRVDLELVRRWCAMEVSARIFALQPANADHRAAVPAGVHVDLGSAGGRRFRYAWPLILWRLIQASRRTHVVVSGSELGIALIFSFLAARLTRRPFAVLVHSRPSEAMVDWSPRWQHRAVRWIHRHSDALTCVSDRIVTDLVSAGVSPELIRVVPNGIDVDTVRQLANQPPAVVRSSSRRTVLAVGRLSREKGFDLLIRAHRLLCDIGTVPHRIVLLGDGPDRAKLANLADSLGVGDSVVFAGFQTNPLPDIASADVLCMPSRYEGFPLVLLEALALGVPVIASPSGGELLAEGSYGVIVPAESPESLASAIDEHLRDPARLCTLAERGPDRVREYDLATIAAHHLVWLRELAGCTPDLRAV